MLVLNFGAMIGAIGGGWLADRFHIKYVLVGMYALAAVSITLLGYQAADRGAVPDRRPRRRVDHRHADRDLCLRRPVLSDGDPRDRHRLGARASAAAARILAPIVIGALVGIALPLQQNFMAIAIPAVIAAVATLLIDHRRSASAHHEDVSATIADAVPAK